MLALAVIMIAVTVFVFVLSLAAPNAAIRSRLVQTMQGSATIESRGGVPPASKRLLAPLAEGISQGAKRLLPSSILQGYEQRLILAGEPMSLNAFLTMHVLVTGSFIALPLLMIVAMGAALSMTTAVVSVGFVMAGVLLPKFWLNQRSGARQNQIIKSLPDSFDLVTTCVEAGLGLDAALARVAEKVEGPFADELARTLREISLGRPRKEALKELGTRTGVPDLVSFVNAVVQAEEMGSSVGRVLRVQSDQLRVRRRQRAEAQAYKAPVKMIFPLVLCIFPALFIVILGPAVITIMQDFPGR